ncbi:MAG: hypothetical protein ACUVR4_07105 [Anaerolineae bacterium]
MAVRIGTLKPEVTRDYSTTNMFALVASLLLLIAFIFLPWFGDRPVINGARLFSDNLYRVPGAILAPLIWLIPIASLTGIILALWGILRPEQDRLAAYLGLAAEVIGLVYFAHFLLNPTARPAELVTGNGFWVSLFALLAQVLGLPVTRLWSAHRKGGARRRSGVPTQVIPYLFLAPALALYVVWIIGPTVYTFLFEPHQLGRRFCGRLGGPGQLPSAVHQRFSLH